MRHFTNAKGSAITLPMTVLSACASLIRHCAMTPLLIVGEVAVLDGFTTQVRADDIVMLSGGRSQITGKLKSIDEQGNVEILSKLTPDPIVLKGEAVDNIECGDKQENRDIPRSRIELSNGDIFPASVESIDSEHLTVLSPHMGKLVIPREVVAAVRTGNQSPRLLYQGPGERNQWTEENLGTSEWKFENRAMICTGPAYVSRDLDLPRHFILKFTLVWHKDATPNFTTTFADPLTGMMQSTDRYILSFDGKQLEIKRESALEEKSHSLIKHKPTAAQLNNDRLPIEVRADRNTGKMELLLQNESVGKFVDSIPNIPKGEGLMVFCQAKDGYRQEIRDLEIYGKDDLPLSELIKKADDQRSDLLISREDDRWSGALESIRTLDGELTFSFKTASDQILMELAEKDVSLVRLASPQKPTQAAVGHSFLLRLFDAGSLTVTSYRLTDGIISATHPLLGPVTLPSGSISTMQRVASAPQQ
jgi:hypothetical protein